MHRQNTFAHVDSLRLAAALRANRSAILASQPYEARSWDKTDTIPCKEHHPPATQLLTDRTSFLMRRAMKNASVSPARTATTAGTIEISVAKLAESDAFEAAAAETPGGTRTGEDFKMADSHAPDPNAAPLRQEIVENFAPVHILIAALLGGTAIIVGLVLGLVLVNN